VVGALAAAIVVRTSQRATAATGDATAVVLEFNQADLAAVEAHALARWLPVSGALQPVNQSTVRSKVSGELRQVMVREGETVRAGQMIARFDTADLEVRLTDRMGAMESSRAQLALAEKTRAQNLALLKQNFISQTAYDSAESNFSVTQGTLKSNEAQVQLARIALRDASWPRSVGRRQTARPARRESAFDAPLTIDLTQMELRRWSGQRYSGAHLGMKVTLAIDGFGERRFTARSIASIRRRKPARSWCSSMCPTPTVRSRRHVRDRPRHLAAGAPVPTLPAIAVRTEAGQNFVWTIENGKLARRIITAGRRDDSAGLVEIKTALPSGIPILAAPFDNLKIGLPAAVRAATGARSGTAG
jgi:multidrug efflux pump subunit AcrA (membrane-fusion protein)